MNKELCKPNNMVNYMRVPAFEIAPVKEILDRGSDNKISPTINNYVIILSNDPYLKDTIRYNLLTDRTDIVKPTPWTNTTRTLTDSDTDFLTFYIEKNYGIRNEKIILRAINIVAMQNKFHPIQDYLLSLKWDGEERIRYGLNHFLGSDINEYTYQALKLFMLGAISRVFNPGCKFESMLCLVGGQGAGKSTFFRFLAIRDEWFSDDLKKLDDENIYRKLQGHWIIEMSEMLASANARSIEEIKSFLSRCKETYKVPYAIQPEDKLRQCIFGGTSNVIDFLPLDRTGNRRFLPIMVYPEDAEVHILDDEFASRAYINQMWAEAMEIYNEGNFLLSLPKEILTDVSEIQSQFMQEDIKTGIIQEYLDTYTGNLICSKQIFHEAFHRPTDEPKKVEIREINSIMNNTIQGWHPFKNPRHFAMYGRQKGWERDNEILTTKEDAAPIITEITDPELMQMEIPDSF